MRIGSVGRMAALLLASAVCWYLAARAAGVTEPWDAPTYWRWWYPAALAIAAVAGAMMREGGWAGVVIVVAQAPAMMIGQSGDASFALLPLGMAMLIGLAIPAAVAAMIGAWVAAWARGRGLGRDQ